MSRHFILFAIAGLSVWHSANAMQQAPTFGFTPSQEARELANAFRRGNRDSEVNRRFAEVWTRFQNNYFIANEGGALQTEVVHNLAFVQAFLILVQNTARAAADREDLFFAAANDGALETVQFFIDNRHDLNGQDEIGGTALHHAAAGGHQEVVALLVRHIDVHAIDQYGETARDWALRNQRHDVAAVLQQIAEETIPSGTLAANRLAVNLREPQSLIGTSCSDHSYLATKYMPKK